MTSCIMDIFLYSQFIAEFDLRSVQYEVKSPRCHEMRLAAPPHDCIRFNFRCDREAEEWATVVMSSLREAHRGQSSFLYHLIYIPHDPCIFKSKENFTFWIGNWIKYIQILVISTVVHCIYMSTFFR